MNVESLKTIEGLLACPVCKEGKILGDKDGYLCPACHHRYPIIHEDGEPMVDFLPDADSRFPNPVQKLWGHLLQTSSVCEQGLFLHGMTFDNMNAMHAEFEVEGKSVLDIGGGSGYLRRYLKPDQLYVDLEPDPAAYPRRALFKELDAKLVEPFIFLRGVGEYVPFRSAVFDAVYMGGMIEHFFDINFAFSEASRVLREGGRLYIFAGVRGLAVKNTQRSTGSKIMAYLRSNGLLPTFRRILVKLTWVMKQKCSPWKGLIDFTHAQVETGHIYDNLFRKDVLELAERYDLRISQTIDIASSGDTVFIFTKP